MHEEIKVLVTMANYNTIILKLSNQATMYHCKVYFLAQIEFCRQTIGGYQWSHKSLPIVKSHPRHLFSISIKGLRRATLYLCRE